MNNQKAIKCVCMYSLSERSIFQKYKKQKVVFVFPFHYSFLHTYIFKYIHIYLINESLFFLAVSDCRDFVLQLYACYMHIKRHCNITLYSIRGFFSFFLSLHKEWISMLYNIYIEIDFSPFFHSVCLKPLCKGQVRNSL